MTLQVHWDWGNDEASSVMMPERKEMFKMAGICLSLCACDEIVKNVTTNSIHREN